MATRKRKETTRGASRSCLRRSPATRTVIQVATAICDVCAHPVLRLETATMQEVRAGTAGEMMRCPLLPARLDDLFCAPDCVSPPCRRPSSLSATTVGSEAAVHGSSSMHTRHHHPRSIKARARLMDVIPNRPWSLRRVAVDGPRGPAGRVVSHRAPRANASVAVVVVAATIGTPSSPAIPAVSDTATATADTVRCRVPPVRCVRAYRATMGDDDSSTHRCSVRAGRAERAIGCRGAHRCAIGDRQRHRLFRRSVDCSRRPRLGARDGGCVGTRNAGGRAVIVRGAATGAGTAACPSAERERLE